MISQLQSSSEFRGFYILKVPVNGKKNVNIGCDPEKAYNLLGCHFNAVKTNQKYTTAKQLAATHHVSLYSKLLESRNVALRVKLDL